MPEPDLSWGLCFQWVVGGLVCWHQVSRLPRQRLKDKNWLGHPEGLDLVAKSSDRGEVESDMQLDGGDCVVPQPRFQSGKHSRPGC